VRLRAVEPRLAWPSTRCLCRLGYTRERTGCSRRERPVSMPLDQRAVTEGGVRAALGLSDARESNPVPA
jgi:hypothetical protein